MLWGKCSDLAPALSEFSVVSTAVCLAYFLFKKDFLEHSFSISLKIVDEEGTQRRG
jgi:hypothetical protein